jgi:hypothetical protein
MGRDGGRRQGGGTQGPRSEVQAKPGEVGKRTLVEAAYPALAQAMPADGAAPTMQDAATAAVEAKGAGTPVDASVATKVGAHLGADFSGVRVHHDRVAHEASNAMGARAFAHGSDVFLGAGEAPTDLGLMAHELTHVAQQGGAGTHAAQRKVEVGEANSPAEHEADTVAGAVTAGAPPAMLLIDSGAPSPGQMLKSSFIAELRAQISAAADAEAGPVYAVIEQSFLGYAARPATELEAQVRRFAPARGVRDAGAMIADLMTRLRAGVQQWRDTGQPPPEVASMAIAGAAPAAGGSAGPAGPIAARALRAPDGRETLASLEATLGPGTPVDGAIAGRVAGTLGIDVDGARLHTGPVAAAKAAEAGAVAFAAGTNIVLGAGAPAAGTLEGDALLAHELVHTSQQASAARDPVARRKPLGDEAASAEAEADHGAANVLAASHGGARANQLRNWAKTDLQLQRCDGCGKTPAATVVAGTFATVAPAVRAAPNAAARETALVAGITGSTQRLSDLMSLTGSGNGPIVALRRSIIAETGVGGPGRALDVNPYVSLRASHVEAAWRAWGESPSSTEPWTLLAIWMKEGLSAPAAPNTVPASDAVDARAIYRSQYYYQNMGADHYIHFTAAAGDNAASFAPGTGAAHDAAFHAGIAAQLAAGRLPRDIGAEIDAQLTVTPPAVAGGGFTVTAGPRFQTLSLMLVDAFFRENRGSTTTDLGAHGMTAGGDDLDAMSYMRWNMGAGRFNTMLGRSMAGNADPDGSTPALPTWSLHRQVVTGEWDQPRANAIRFQYYQHAFRFIFEAGY